MRWSFYLGGLVFLLAVLCTILTVKEYSPAEQEEFNPVVSDAAAKEGSAIELNTGRYLAEGSALVVAGSVFAYFVHSRQWDKALYILSFGLAVYGALQLLAALRYSMGKVDGLVEIIYDLKNMPRTMKQLALVTVFTWFALFAMFIYANSAVTTYHFGSTDTRSAAYNDGANWVGVLMAVYNGVAALVAPFLPDLAQKDRPRLDPCDLSDHRRTGPDLHVPFQGPQVAAHVHDRGRHRLGQPADHALCDSEHRRCRTAKWASTWACSICSWSSRKFWPRPSWACWCAPCSTDRPSTRIVLGGVAMMLAGFLMLFVKDKAKTGEIS